MIECCHVDCRCNILRKHNNLHVQKFANCRLAQMLLASELESLFSLKEENRAALKVFLVGECVCVLL